MGATKISEVAVQLEAIGLDKVRSALRELEGDASRKSSSLQLHYSKAARNIALVGQEAVRAGEIGGSGLRKLLTVGGDMVTTFGVGGPIVGAFALTGLAIYNYFDRAQQKIAETAAAARAELRSIRDGSAESAARAINRISSGETLATPEELAKRPLIGSSSSELRAEERRLQARVSAAGQNYDARTGLSTGSADPDAANRLGQVNAELAYRNDLIKKATPLLQSLAKAEGERVIIEGKAALVSKDDAEAQRALELAIKRGQDAAQSATTSIMRRLEVEDEARKTREKAGIREPGALTDMGAAASDTGAQLKQLQQANPFDWDAWFTQLSEGANGIDAGLKQHAQEVGDKIKTTLARTLGDAIYAGFSAAFSGKGLSGVFKAFTKTVLSGIGQLFTQQGMVYLEYAALLSGFTPFLFNPVTSAWAAAGIGVALMAMGAALGALGSGGGGRGAGASAVARPSEITNIKLTATSVADQARYEARTPVYMTVIGPGDPVAFRQIQEGLDNHGRR